MSARPRVLMYHDGLDAAEVARLLSHVGRAIEPIVLPEIPHSQSETAARIQGAIRRSDPPAPRVRSPHSSGRRPRAFGRGR